LTGENQGFKVRINVCGRAVKSSRKEEKARIVGAGVDYFKKSGIIEPVLPCPVPQKWRDWIIFDYCGDNYIVLLFCVKIIN
jgi:hypothetical protein